MKIKVIKDKLVNQTIEVNDIRKLKHKIQEIKTGALNNENIALLQKLDEELSYKFEKIIKDHLIEETQIHENK